MDVDVLPNENDGVDVAAAGCVVEGVPNENALQAIMSKGSARAFLSVQAWTRLFSRLAGLSSLILLVLLAEAAKREGHAGMCGMYRLEDWEAESVMVAASTPR